MCFCYHPGMQPLRLRPFQLARLSGVPLMVDYTWLFVVLIYFWLGSQIYLVQQTGRIGLTEALVFGGFFTVLMFSSIIIHEIAHAFIAQQEGINTLEIRLHIFGGYARLAGDPKTALAELRIAIAGPVASFLLGAFFMMCVILTQAFAPDAVRLSLRELFLWLFRGNIALAMFNLIPGLPLDGGRVLRAYLWHRSNDILAATLVAKRLGVGLSYMLASYGIYRAIWYREPFVAVMLITLAFILKKAAEEDYRFRKLQSEYTEQTGVNLQELSGTVATVMKQSPITVPPTMRISEFIDGVLAKHRQTNFPVALEGRLYGLLGLEKLRAVPESDWGKTIVRDVMHPVDDSLFVPMKASIEHATSKLKASPLQYLAVIDGDGILVGSLSAAELERVA